MLFVYLALSETSETSGDTKWIIGGILLAMIICYFAWRLFRDIRAAMRIDLEGIHLEDL